MGSKRIKRSSCGAEALRAGLRVRVEQKQHCPPVLWGPQGHHLGAEQAGKERSWGTVTTSQPFLAFSAKIRVAWAVRKTDLIDLSKEPRN